MRGMSPNDVSATRTGLDLERGREREMDLAAARSRMPSTMETNVPRLPMISPPTQPPVMPAAMPAVPRVPMKKGGKVKKAKGGSVSSASKRADGCAQRGKTRGKFV